MSKLLKPLIIVLFVLSLGALALGTLLYMKREVVKGRTQNLEAAVTTIARNLEYARLNGESLKDLDAMRSELSGLATASKEEHSNLVATTETLDQTKVTLQDTEQTLETTQSELRQSQDEVTTLEDDVAAKQSDINRKEQQIASLEDETSSLQDQVGQLENNHALALADLDDLDAEYKALEEAYKVLVRETESRQASSASDSPGILPVVDVEGKVLLVNPEWNFVIIDKGSEDELRENVILLVHRGLDPIGKVRIRHVQESIAVAEIVSSWEDSVPVEGDDVISPRSPS